MKEAIVIKDGITELSTAWKLSENGYKVSIIECEKSFGWLVKFIKLLIKFIIIYNIFIYFFWNAINSL